MKKQNLLILILSFIFIFSFNEMAFGDAKAHRWNKCRKGLNHRAKAKANGPGCIKEVNKDKQRCPQEAKATAIVDRPNGSCDCTNSITGLFGAFAEAIANNNEESTLAEKIEGCSGYKAGGTNFNYRLEYGFFMPPPTPGPGLVGAFIKCSTDQYDYVNNTITLNDLNGYLEINSADFINEFSVISIEVSIITVDDSGMVITENPIFFTEASFINGSLAFSGDQGGFSSGDFTAHALDNGIRYTLDEVEEKVIELEYDIDSSMLIEVIFTSDVGNILDEEPANRSSIDISSSKLNNDQVNVNIIYEVQENSEKKNEGSQKTSKSIGADLEIRDILGKVVYKTEKIELINGEVKKVQIPNMNFIKQNFYVIILKASNGEIKAKLLMF